MLYWALDGPRPEDAEGAEKMWESDLRDRGAGNSRPSQLRWAGGLLCLSAATLLLEIAWTRLYSVAQFYHFAFMVISLAMLGYGASGTLLALLPRLGRRRPQAALALLSLGLGMSGVGAYLLTNFLPFDSFSIALDRRQVGILALHYVVLALPFFCGGAALALLLAGRPHDAGRVYAVNLAGSALGCLLALAAPAVLGGEGTIVLCGLLGGAAACAFALGGRPRRLGPAAAGLAWIAACLAALLVRPPFLEVRLSPYKGLSYALQYPGATVAFRAWNSFSRVDLVESRGVRSLPGLSYLYLEPPPPQRGLLVDGDDLSPVLVRPAGEAEPPLAFTGFLPTALAYRLRPGARALVLEPRGGLEVWIALAQGAAQVTAVEPNPLVVAAAGEVYAHPRVTTVVEDPRSFLRRPGDAYDVIVLALTTPYHPIRSGAYSLAEDYIYTVESFGDALARLRPGGLLVVSRWLQVPPSEELRALALAIAAVEAAGGDPARQIAAFRGYSMLTMLVKGEPFADSELAALRGWTAARAWDLVYAPDLRPDEVNRFNVLPDPLYEESFAGLLRAADRAAWYAAYPLDVAPPTDDRPFFGHFFRWSQAGQVVAELGKTWQPFGGAGYLVLILFLALALAAATLLILLPLAVAGRRGRPAAPGAALPAASLGYFALLGLAYMSVEIPLLQRFVLFLGHPAYALTAVLFALLAFSGLGSLLAPRLPLRLALGLLVALLLAYPLFLPALLGAALGLLGVARALVALLALAPAGLLMGMPFPRGLAGLDPAAPGQVPWAWGVNGAASVVAAVLAALLSLSWGFRWVLAAGALLYAGAWALAPRGARRGSGLGPSR